MCWGKLQVQHGHIWTSSLAGWLACKQTWLIYDAIFVVAQHDNAWASIFVERVYSMGGKDLSNRRVLKKGDRRERTEEESRKYMHLILHKTKGWRHRLSWSPHTERLAKRQGRRRRLVLVVTFLWGGTGVGVVLTASAYHFRKAPPV